MELWFPILRDNGRTKFLKMPFLTNTGKNQAAKSLPFMSVSFEILSNLSSKGKLAVLAITTKNKSAFRS